MPKNLSIKRVPEKIVRRLRERAKANHRSLQGELLSIVEQAASEEPLTVAELRRLKALRGLRTPSESVAMIREDRDAR
jgi:antitoxin FitA